MTVTSSMTVYFIKLLYSNTYDNLEKMRWLNFCSINPLAQFADDNDISERKIGVFVLAQYAILTSVGSFNTLHSCDLLGVTM